jgi:hypothetical protein
MKKFTLTLVTAVLMLITVPTQAKEVSRPSTATTTALTASESAKVNALISRVNEINAMDKSTLSHSERKQLRSELRSIKREVNHTQGNVVYVSGGLILLIVLLIILL